jgi:long-chain acyl-CoA synthetase
MNVAILGEKNVEKFGEYEALIFENERYTNVQLLDRAQRFASALAGLGVRPGDRVAVMLPNSPAVGTCYGAIPRLGAVTVPMLFLLAVPEVVHILRDSEAKVIITSPEFHPNVAQACAQLENPPTVVVFGDPVPEDALSFTQLLEDAKDAYPIVDREAEDIAVISYTSGTTGRPKGVMLTHGNLLFNSENTASVVNVEQGERSIACLPLAHLFGFGAALTGNLFQITGILLRWFTAEAFFDAVQTHRGNSSAVVPTMLSYMLAHPSFDDVDWSSFEWIVAAAAPVPMELSDEFEKRTGARVLQGYGLTETSPTVTFMRRSDPPRPGSCGRPVPNIEVKIVDLEGKDLPAGEPGEVLVRGPNIMKGYHGMPKETGEVIEPDGWFHTGDIGHLDEDGYLYITERKKDLIIRGGFNIFPRDIEELLYGHPAVQEAAVVGVPDALMGEEVVAYVTRRPGAEVTKEELLSWCRDRLAKYKTPKEIRFLDTLPKNPIGKILKKDLRELARGGSDG